MEFSERFGAPKPWSFQRDLVLPSHGVFIQIWCFEAMEFSERFGASKPCLRCFGTVWFFVHFQKMQFVVDPCEGRTELQRMQRVNEILRNGHN